MPEIKHIRVREAKPRDIGLFRKLWSGLLAQQAQEGSIVAPTEKTLSLYEKLFNAYIEGDLEGVVLFVADRGVLMWGDNGSALDYPGKTVTVWGAYVAPGSSEGIESALLKHARAWAEEHEFTGLLAQSYKGSETLEGFEPVATILYRSLDG